MVAFSTIKNGDTLYDCHRYRMGNTTRTKMGTWLVRVLEVYPDRRSARVSWNSNTAEIWSETRLRRLRRTPVKEK